MHITNSVNQQFSLASATVPQIDTMKSALTPQNFDQILAKYRQDSVPEYRELFKAQGDLFVCYAQPHLTADQKIWLIDADDTLWEDNIHYINVTQSFVNYALNSGVPLTNNELVAYLDNVEHEVIPIHGFGAEGYAISVKTAWERLKAEYSLSAEDPIGLIDGIVPLLRGVPFEIPEDTRHFINGLKSDQTNYIVLFTQGPVDIQLDKIKNSALASHFDAIAVGTNKKNATYSELIRRISESPGEVIVVGNSLNSEVRPALELGFKAFHFSNPNSWHAVNSSNLDKGAYIQVNKLTDILNYL